METETINEKTDWENLIKGFSEASIKLMENSALTKICLVSTNSPKPAQ